MNKTPEKKVKKGEGGGMHFEMPVVDRRDVMMASAPSNIWLISFTDVIALMLTFFVLIFSMINPERDVYSNITYSLKENTGFGSTESMGRTASDPNQRMQIIRGEDLNYLASVLRQNITGRGELYGTEILNMDQRLVIRLPNQLLFDSGAYELRSTAERELASLFTLLKNLKNAVEVYGYTDPSPVTSGGAAYQSNFGLAQQRAGSVARLIYQTGYRKAVGLYGIETTDSTDVDYNDLRRVEIVIHENRNTVF